MTCLLSPNHWNSKFHWFYRFSFPSPQTLKTVFAHHMRSPWFILTCYANAKIWRIILFHWICDIHPTLWKSIFTPDITKKNVGNLLTHPSWRSHQGGRWNSGRCRLIYAQPEQPHKLLHVCTYINGTHSRTCYPMKNKCNIWWDFQVISCYKLIF